MPRDKKEVVPAKPQNPFAALAGLDSSDSDSEEVEAPVAAPPAVPASPPLRTWPTNEKGSSVFNSPFSKKSARWSKPRFKEDNDGWVSIRWNQPQFQEEGGAAPAPLSVQYQPRTPPFYSGGDPDAETKVLEDDSPLYASVTPPNLELGEPIVPPQEVVLEETITPLGPGQEQLTALAWAERVKKSLEKAEAARASKARPTDPKADEDFKEALGRLSFFRRGMVATSSPEQE